MPPAAGKGGVSTVHREEQCSYAKKKAGASYGQLDQIRARNRPLRHNDGVSSIDPHARREWNHISAWSNDFRLVHSLRQAGLTTGKRDVVDRAERRVIRICVRP